jgi:hypothetical protein
MHHEGFFAKRAGQGLKPGELFSAVWRVAQVSTTFPELR